MRRGYRCWRISIEQDVVSKYEIKRKPAVRSWLETAMLSASIYRYRFLSLMWERTRAKVPGTVLDIIDCLIELRS